MDMSVGERVKIVREREGITRTEMARLLGVTTATYSSREDGKAEWRLDELAKVADRFSLPVRELLGF